MFKNFSLVFFSLLALGTSPALLATVQPPDGAVPALTTPFNPGKPANTDNKIPKQPANKTQLNTDELVDYRYCLDLKSNREIAECRYKK